MSRYAAGMAAGYTPSQSFVTSTTLTAETSNNTSASSSMDSAFTTNGNIVPGNISKRSVKTLLGPWFNGLAIIHMMGWWTQQGHVSGVGYDSDDPAQVQKQLEDMISRGFDAMQLSWYGDGTLSDDTMLVWKAKAEADPRDFKISVMMNEAILNNAAYGSTPEARVTNQCEYVCDTYLGSSRYLYYDVIGDGIGWRPVIFFFIDHTQYLSVANTDGLGWQRVRTAIKNKGFPEPLFVIKDKRGYGYPASSPAQPQMNGAQSWGVADTGAYYDDFYGVYDDDPSYYEDHLMFGDTNKGFDDSLAGWGTGRFVDQENGQRWLDLWDDFDSHFNPARNANAKPVTGMTVATWNDYEEGTAIECGIDAGLTISASITDDTLSWTLGGNTNAAARVKIYASLDGENLALIADVPTSPASYDLTQASLASNTYSIFAKVEAHACIKNAMSTAQEYIV